MKPWAALAAAGVPWVVIHPLRMTCSIAAHFCICRAFLASCWCLTMSTITRSVRIGAIRSAVSKRSFQVTRKSSADVGLSVKAILPSRGLRYDFFNTINDFSPSHSKLSDTSPRQFFAALDRFLHSDRGQERHLPQESNISATVSQCLL